MDNSFLSDSLGPLENADCKLISADLCQCHPGTNGNTSVIRMEIHPFYGRLSVIRIIGLKKTYTPHV